MPLFVAVHDQQGLLPCAGAPLNSPIASYSFRQRWLDRHTLCMPLQVAGQSSQPSWDKPSLRAHHRGGAHRNIFEDHSHDIFGPSSSGASKHSNPHHHRAGPSTPSSPYRPKEAPKDFAKDFPKESGKDYGGAWGADLHQSQAGARGGNPRDRLSNARGPVLNGAGPDGKAAARGPAQRHQQVLSECPSLQTHIHGSVHDRGAHLGACHRSQAQGDELFALLSAKGVSRCPKASAACSFSGGRPQVCG